MWNRLNSINNEFTWSFGHCIVNHISFIFYNVHVYLLWMYFFLNHIINNYYNGVKYSLILLGVGEGVVLWALSVFCPTYWPNFFLFETLGICHKSKAVLARFFLSNNSLLGWEHRHNLCVPWLNLPPPLIYKIMVNNFAYHMNTPCCAREAVKTYFFWSSIKNNFFWSLKKNDLCSKRGGALKNDLFCRFP